MTSVAPGILGEAADIVSRAVRESNFAELVEVREEILRVTSVPDGSLVEDLTFRSRVLVKALVGGSWISASLPRSTLQRLAGAMEEAEASPEVERLILPRMGDGDGAGMAIEGFSPEEDADVLWEVVDALRGGPDSLSASCTVRRLSIRNSLGVEAESSEVETAVVAFWHSRENWFRPADEEVLGGWARPSELRRGILRRAEEARSSREGGGPGLRISEPPVGVPLVLAPTAAGTLIHELLQHGLEGDEVAEGRSYLSGMLGARVAADLLTVRSGPPHAGWTIDHEGVIAEETELVSRGLVRSYLTDVQSALRLGRPPIGCGRVAGEEPPAPRATFLSVDPAPGGPDLGEMTSELETALLVERASGGSTDPSSGEFRVSAPSALVLRRGDPVAATPPLWLEGTCSTVLGGISSVGDRPEEFVTICAKGGGMVLTKISSPPMVVSGGVIRVALA